MGLSKRPYKGTRDFFPQQKRVQDYIFLKMKNAAELFGYESYDGPLLEEVELYKAKSGEELINDQIYSFTDRGNRFVAIRPEMTPTLARMVANIHKEAPLPIRWFSIPNLYRYEKPQKGRLREHWQFNCDIFGASKRNGELEIIQLAVNFLTSFGATSEHFEILVNDRVIIDSVFKEIMKLDDEKIYKLYKIVDKAKKVTPASLDQMINDLNISTEQSSIFKNYLNLKKVSELKKFLTKYNKYEECLSFFDFLNQLETIEIDQFVTYDPTIVRGLDYYTGIVFEIFDKHPENRRAICGGGSYANLLKIFGEKPLPGVGLGLGDVTLTDFLKIHNLLPDLEKAENDIFLTAQVPEAMPIVAKLAKSLRENGIKAILQFETIRPQKAFTLAEKRGAKFICLIGDREVEESSVQLKNLQTKEQTTSNISDLKKIIEVIRG